MSTTPERADRGMFAADFDALRVGDGYRSPPRTIATGDVSVFGALTGDQHPIHVDPEWAARGPFGQPIAHGLLVLSCAIGALPLDPERIVALRRIREATFKRPLVVGDAIEVRCEVSGLRPLDGETGLVECALRIAGPGDRLHVRSGIEILWRRGEFTPVEVTDDGLRVLI